MSELKMSNSFSLPLVAEVELDYCDEYNYNIYDAHGDLIMPCVPDDVNHEAIVEAVNNHDTLTETLRLKELENHQLAQDKAELVRFVEMVANGSSDHEELAVIHTKIHAREAKLLLEKHK